MANPAARLPDYSAISEASLSFDPIESAQSHSHPLRGLAEYGPYSAGLNPALARSPLRLAFVTIEGQGSRLRDYLNSICDVHRARDKSGYFPDFPGFHSTFGLDISIPQGPGDTTILIPEADARKALNGREPELAFLGMLESSLKPLLLRRTSFDVLLFYFPAFVEPIFHVYRDNYEFDLHHATKAMTATAGVPSQIILDRSIDYADRCSVLWSLSVALYAKAGGIPWKLQDTLRDTAYVGLSYVLRKQDSRQEVLTCCSQLFDDQGHGLQFLLFTADDFRLVGRNPFLSRSDMRRLLTKTLDVYVRQTGGLPRRLVVHKTTRFTADERSGAAEALGDLDGFDLLQIQEDTSWAAVKGEGGTAAPYPVNRGTAMPISKYSFLLWTQGDVRGVALRGSSYFQEGRGIPAPLMITQYAGSTTMVESASEILGLTKMNWNTGRLYNHIPVTVKSASALGKTAKYMSSVSQAPYQFRLFM